MQQSRYVIFNLHIQRRVQQLEEMKRQKGAAKASPPESGEG